MPSAFCSSYACEFQHVRLLQMRKCTALAKSQASFLTIVRVHAFCKRPFAHSQCCQTPSIWLLVLCSLVTLWKHLQETFAINSLAAFANLEMDDKFTSKTPKLPPTATPESRRALEAQGGITPWVCDLCNIVFGSAQVRATFCVASCEFCMQSGNKVDILNSVELFLLALSIFHKRCCDHLNFKVCRRSGVIAATQQSIRSVFTSLSSRVLQRYSNLVNFSLKNTSDCNNQALSGACKLRQMK